MRIAPPLIVTLLCLSSLCLGLGGCGQKGPLYLPSDPPVSQRPPADDNAPAHDHAAESSAPHSSQ